MPRMQLSHVRADPPFRLNVNQVTGSRVPPVSVAIGCVIAIAVSQRGDRIGHARRCQSLQLCTKIGNCCFMETPIREYLRVDSPICKECAGERKL